MVKRVWPSRTNKNKPVIHLIYHLCVNHVATATYQTVSRLFRFLFFPISHGIHHLTGARFTFRCRTRKRRRRLSHLLLTRGAWAASRGGASPNCRIDSIGIIRHSKEACCLLDASLLTLTKQFINTYTPVRRVMQHRAFIHYPPPHDGMSGSLMYRFAYISKCPFHKLLEYVIEDCLHFRPLKLVKYLSSFLLSVKEFYNAVADAIFWVSTATQHTQGDSHVISQLQQA